MRLVYQAIDNKFVKLTEPFRFASMVIDEVIEVPEGFVFDLESVPRIPIVYALCANTSKRGGCIHDYLCRKDSVPVVSKKIAADVYLELMASRGNPYWRRYIKYWVVRWAWGYFHRFKVLSTYEEITGNKE